MEVIDLTTKYDAAEHIEALLEGFEQELLGSVDSKSGLWSASLLLNLLELYDAQVGVLSSPFYDEILRDSPRFSVVVDGLKSERSRLLRNTMELAERLTWADWPDASKETLYAARKIVEQFGELEEREREVLQEAYSVDLGVAG